MRFPQGVGAGQWQILVRDGPLRSEETGLLDLYDVGGQQQSAFRLDVYPLYVRLVDVFLKRLS